MIITVELVDRSWQVVDPRNDQAAAYHSGPDAFDAAVDLAREHHGRTGQASTVRVEAAASSVEALRFS